MNEDLRIYTESLQRPVEDITPERLIEAHINCNIARLRGDLNDRDLLPFLRAAGIGNGRFDPNQAIDDARQDPDVLRGLGQFIKSAPDPQPLPPDFLNLSVDLMTGKLRRPPRREGAPSKPARNRFVITLIQAICRSFPEIKATRNPLSPNECACNLVADALSLEGMRVTEKTIETIWGNRSKIS